MLNRAFFAIAVLLGLAIAYMDSRPHWDDAGITAGSMFAFAAVLGAIAHARTVGSGTFVRRRPSGRRSQTRG